MNTFLPVPALRVSSRSSGNSQRLLRLHKLVSSTSMIK